MKKWIVAIPVLLFLMAGLTMKAQGLDSVRNPNGIHRDMDDQDQNINNMDNNHPGINSNTPGYDNNTRPNPSLNQNNGSPNILNKTDSSTIYKKGGALINTDTNSYNRNMRGPKNSDDSGLKKNP